jgi:hypothetical protein
MKYLAIFLASCILLLSSVSVMASPHQGQASCCKESTHKDCCKQKKQTSDNNCAKGTCNAMLSCSNFGFIPSPSVSLSPVMIDLNNQIAHPFITGQVSDYHDNDWNPPKA